MIKQKKVYSCNTCKKEFSEGFNYLEISLDGHEGAQIGFVDDDSKFYIDEDKHYCDFKCLIADLKINLNIA